MTFDPFGDFATEGYLRNVANRSFVLRSPENVVVGNVDAPQVKALYEAMLVRRGKKP